MHDKSSHPQVKKSCKRQIPWLLLGAVLVISVSGLTQESSPPPSDQRTAVTRHLNMTYPVPEYRTKEEWLARRENLRLQILMAAGLLPAPERCQLNAQIFGRLERGGYTIEKVYFESYPGFFVTGNLYRPKGQKGPFPGVLSPHGHWPYGRLQNTDICSVPTRCISLAKQGYVVFSYDMVGYNDSIQVDHRFQGERESLWGFSPLGLQLWDSIRAADFLESLPDVDKKRLACTGESGGGTQTFLLTAVDERISASAPVNMISAHMQGGDVCENAPNLRIDTNNVEIGAMMAPRPMIMVSATGDWTKDTLEVEFPAIQRVYGLLGAGDKVTAVRVNAEHNYNRESREHVYRWFGRWLLGDLAPESLVEKGVHVEPVPEVLVFYGRDLPKGMKNQRQIIEDFVRAADSAVDALKPVDSSGWERFNQAYEPAFRFSTMAEYPAPGEIHASEGMAIQQGSYLVSRFFLSRRGKGDRVPVTLWDRAGRTTERQGVILLHPKGADAFESAGAPRAMVQSLLKQGCTVLIPDLFNTGRAASQRTDKKEFFTTYNRTDDANRIQDILTSLAYFRVGKNSLPIKVVAYDVAGLWSICARALVKDNAWFAVDAIQFNATSDDAYLKLLNIPGICRAGGLRTAATLNLRSRLWVSNAGPGFPTAWIQSVYQSLGKGDMVRIEAEPATDTSILQWITAGTVGAK